MKKNIIGLFCLVLIFSFSAINIKAEETSGGSHSLSLTFEEITSIETIYKNVEVEGGIVKYTIEDIPQITSFSNPIEIFYPNGNWVKRITVSEAGTEMTATFSFTINPYTPSVHSATDGRYKSLLGAFIRDRENVRYNRTQMAYEVDYTTYFGGTLTMSLLCSVHTNGTVIFTMRGM